MLSLASKPVQLLRCQGQRLGSRHITTSVISATNPGLLIPSSKPSSSSSTRSTRFVSSSTKNVTPSSSSSGRQSTQQHPYTTTSSSPIIHSNGSIEWRVPKGSRTFGLDLNQTPPPSPPPTTTPFPHATNAFPGALTNSQLLDMIQNALTKAGYDPTKTLVATSFCCDEVNRPLELDLSRAYDQNFTMGGLAGFPFGGKTSFGAMTAHVPDGGDCLVVYGPHVGVDGAGTVGTVERRGKVEGGACCGSAVAAAGYVSNVFNKGGEKRSIPEDDAFDAQQIMVGELLLPHAERLETASDKMKELPMALYDAQREMMSEIVGGGMAACEGGMVAVLGGIQINTPPEYSDYFLPLSFELFDDEGELVEDLLTARKDDDDDAKPFPKVLDLFPGALPNATLMEKITTALETDAGYSKDKTLVATSLCCDEVNRPLERDLSQIFSPNFNMGGLAGFPFGGATSFGAMASHVPDGGDCLVVFGPHVGVDSHGVAGTVERRGKENGGSCCGSAVAAAGYVSDVGTGLEDVQTTMPDVGDAQQYFVGRMLLPHAERLERSENKMVELPMALYDAQKKLMDRIVTAKASAVGKGGRTAVLGGIQINTPEGYSDYYLPLMFDLYDDEGVVVKNLLWDS